MTLLRNLLLTVAVLAAPALAQVPAPAPAPAPASTPTPASVEERSRALQQGQQRTSMVYRHLEQVRYDAKLAEQAVLNARDVHTAAQQQTALRQRELEAAQKVLTAARTRVTAAEQAYEKEISAVDAVYRAGQPVVPVK